MYTIICICVPVFLKFIWLTNHFFRCKPNWCDRPSKKKKKRETVFTLQTNHTETGYSSFSGRLSPSCKCCSLPYIWILDTMEYCCRAALRGVAGVLQNQSKKDCVRERRYREALRSCCSCYHAFFFLFKEKHTDRCSSAGAVIFFNSMIQTHSAYTQRFQSGQLNISCCSYESFRLFQS